MSCGGSSEGSREGFEGLVETFEIRESGRPEVDQNMRQLLGGRLRPRRMHFPSGNGFYVTAVAPSGLAANLTWTFPTVSGTGVVNTGSSTDNAVPKFVGTTGGVIENTGVLIDDTNNVTGMLTLTLPNNGLHILDTNATHDLIITPGSNLTSDRTWTIATGDADLTTSFSGSAKGDLLAASAAGTFGMFNVGSNGTLLMADSGSTFGMAWSTTLSGSYTFSGTTNTFSNPITLTQQSTAPSAPSAGSMKLYADTDGMIHTRSSVQICCYPCMPTTGLLDDPTKNLLYLKLEEASSPFADSSGNSNNATGGTGTEQATGKINYGRKFTSGDSAIATSAINPGSTGDLDLTFWVKRDGTYSVGSGTTTLLTTANWGNLLFGFQASTGNAYWQFGTGPTTLAQTYPNDQNWHFIHLKWDEATDTMYLSVDDGSEATASASSPTRSSGAVSLTEGTTTDITATYIDEVWIRTELLSSSAVTALYNGGNGKGSPGCGQIPATYISQTSISQWTSLVTLTAGAGLTGGGTLDQSRTVAVGAGTGITVNADDVALDTSHARNVDHSAVTLTAGAGLTGGGDISASRTFAVGAGTGITVNADDVQISATYAGQTSIVTLGTITTGTWDGTDIAVAGGGTGRGTATAYAVLCGGTTATGAHQSIAGVGSAGEVLTSNGAGALPTFQVASGLTISGLTEVDPALADDAAIADASDSGNNKKVGLDRLGGLLVRSAVGGRLTLATGVAVTTTDQTGKGTLYFTPDPKSEWCGFISLFDGTRWALYTFSEVSLSLSVSDNTLYYIYIYDNAGTLTLDVSTTAYTTQDGIRVKTGATARRFLGWGYGSGANTFEDSEDHRGLINWYNQVSRSLFICPAASNGDSNTSWTTTSTTWTSANAGTGSKAEFISDGVHPVEYSAFAVMQSSTASFGVARIGVGESSTSSAKVANFETLPGTSDVGAGSIGRHWMAAEGYQYLELLCNVNANTGTYYADFSRLGSAADPAGTYLTATVWG